MLIAISSWSFHTELYAGKLHLSDVPFRVYDLGYRAVELQDMFLWPRPPGRLARLLRQTTTPIVPAGRGEYDRKALLRTHLNRHRSGAKLVCWTIDSDLTVSGADRLAQKAYLAAAIEAAHFLGAPLMRLTLGGAGDDQAAFDRAVELLRNVLPTAMALNVKLAIENHGGLSADPGRLIDFVQQFPSARGQVVGVCVDFGNFEQAAAAGVRQLAPYAIHAHAKSRAFDSSGEETTIDYGACLDALKDAKYDGAISIEYEGDSDAATGIHQTRDLIEKYWR